MNTIVHTDKAVAGRANNGGGQRRSLWKSSALITALILLIPLFGNHFVDGWNWAPSGFVLAGILIFGICLTYQLVTRDRDTIAYRAAAGMALTATFILIWGNLVQWSGGIPAAAMYFGVPIVGAIGAAVARLRPKGMARALFVTALAQALVLVAALVFLMSRNPEVTSWTPPEWRGFVGNAFFAMVYAGSGLLFRKTGRGESAAGAGAV